MKEPPHNQNTVLAHYEPNVESHEFLRKSSSFNNAALQTPSFVSKIERKAIQHYASNVELVTGTKLMNELIAAGNSN